jgi:hypothetical protein
LTLIQTAAKGLFLDKVSVPGVVLSGHNTWMNSYGEDELGVPVEPEPWQLHYIDCMVCHLTTLSSTICYGQSCKGRCRAESDSKLNCRPTCEGEPPLPYALLVNCVCLLVCVRKPHCQRKGCSMQGSSQTQKQSSCALYVVRRWGNGRSELLKLSYFMHLRSYRRFRSL